MEYISSDFPAAPLSVSTQTDFSIIGVAAGHLSEDKSEFTVDFLGAMGPVEDYVSTAKSCRIGTRGPLARPCIAQHSLNRGCE